jgi:mono/diheme cytochrome c family protein
MSMKRCFELPVSPSLSLLGRAVLVGSVLSFAACARKDAAKSDSASAASDSAATTSAMTATPSSPVESVSTGETTVSAESKANPTVAATNVASGTANTAATPAPGTTAPAPTHHTVHHTDSSTTKRAAAAPSSTASTAKTSTSTTRATAADTGQKTGADTSKKTAAAGGATDHLVVSPQEYEGWKMFSVYCYRCHGVDAMGGGIAPNLRHSVSSEGSVTHDVFITTVTNGRLDKGMPTWKALLSPEQMEDLWLYVNARSSGRLAPGRPHMASGANP